MKKSFGVLRRKYLCFGGVWRTTGEKLVLFAQQVRDPLLANPLMHGSAAKMFRCSDKTYIEPTIEEKRKPAKESPGNKRGDAR